MARPIPNALDDLLAAIPALAGLPATAAHRDRFKRYLDIFLKWNRVHRMTALESPGDIIRGLFLDSLLFFRLLPARPLSVLDIGAGGGIPGLPLRLVDDGIALTLIESKRKRVSFLLAACRELGLSEVHVVEGRAEDLVDREPGLAEGFDVVVARAVGGEALMTLGSRYLRAGGTIAIAGSPKSSAGRGFDVVKVPVPGSRSSSRVFLTRTKDSTVPRGT